MSNLDRSSISETHLVGQSFLLYSYDPIIILCGNFLNREQEAPAAEEDKKQNKHVLRKIAERVENRKLDPHLEDQFASGRLLACISSRPGQCGRADGYILEGKELEFYQKKIQRKEGKASGAAA